MAEVKRDGNGQCFASDFSDEYIWELYEEHCGSTKDVAKQTGLSRSQIRKRLAKIRETLGKHVATASIDHAGKMESLVASIPLVGPGGAPLRKASVRLYGQGMKDELTQKPIKEGLESVGAEWEFGKVDKTKVQWPPVQPYYQVEAPTYIALPPSVNNGFRKVFIIGDVQIGFWRGRNGKLIPFHDEAAIDLMLQMLARYQPDEVVILGDFCDFPEQGKYRKEPAFFNTTNPSIAYATILLAKIRAIVGALCIIWYILGNHELRLTSAVVDNLVAYYGIRRHDAGDSFDVLSVPFLLQFKRFDIRVTEQFPSGEVWLTDNLVCTHAPDPKLAATVISGHLVKATVDSDTRYYRDGAKIYERIIVPGLGNYRGKPEDKFRITRTNIPSNVARSNAQQAVATVDITPDGKRHHIQVWKIENGSAWFREHGIMQGAAEGWQYDEELVA